MNDQQRQASFDRAQASYDNMSPDEGPEPPEGDCPTCGEPSENFDSERDEEGTHVWMKDCESCVNLSNFTGNEKEAIHEWRQEWLNAHPDTQNPETKRWTRHADTRAEINKICDLALEALSRQDDKVRGSLENALALVEIVRGCFIAIEGTAGTDQAFAESRNASATFEEIIKYVSEALKLSDKEGG